VNKIAIVTDSSCDIPKEMMEEHQIHMLPLKIIYKDQEYRDRVEISPEEIYERFSEEVPTSSLPSPEDAHNLLEKLASEGFTHVIGIFISSGLSGTYNMVRTVASDIENLTIELIDSKSLSMGLGFIALEAAKALEKGLSFDAIVSHVKEVVEVTDTYYVIKTLEYLKKGGRIGKVEGTIGDLLNIKPIISVGKDGTYYTYRKVRGRKKSINELYNIAIERIGNKRVNISIAHGDALKEAEALCEKLKNVKGVESVFVDQISPVLAVHTGPGLVGFNVSDIIEL